MQQYENVPAKGEKGDKMHKSIQNKAHLLMFVNGECKGKAEYTPILKKSAQNNECVNRLC